MARGAQKEQSQAKALKKAGAGKKKSAAGAKTQVIVTCGCCRAVIQQLGKTDASALIKLNLHGEQKHNDWKKDVTFATCFPDWTPAKLARKAKAEVDAKPAYKADKAPVEKKKRSHKRNA